MQSIFDDLKKCKISKINLDQPLMEKKAILRGLETIIEKTGSVTPCSRLVRTPLKKDRAWLSLWEPERSH